MKTICLKLNCLSLFVAFAIAVNAQPSLADKLGSSLHKKEKISISEIPEGVISTVKEARPEMKILAAEKEFKNGIVYYDVEGLDKNGKEIELDLAAQGEQWVVVEVQRDLVYNDVPKIIRSTLEKSVPGITPGRIIESDQGNDIVIYEFYTSTKQDGEKKYEVKFEGGEAKLLKKEWKH